MANVSVFAGLFGDGTSPDTGAAVAVAVGGTLVAVADVDDVDVAGIAVAGLVVLVATGSSFDPQATTTAAAATIAIR